MIKLKPCIQSARAACDENPICHTELRRFIGYESFSRPSEPQAKVNTHERQEATHRITTRPVCMVEVLHSRFVQLSLVPLDTVLWSNRKRGKATPSIMQYMHLTSVKMMPEISGQ